MIGGEKMVGQGWRMLMECLAAGRSISLPSSSARRRQVAAAQHHAPMPASASSSTCRSARWKGSRSRSRAWSRTPTSSRRRAASRPSMVSRGEKPSVISALMKYQTTERMRRSLNDAMDLHGGRGICDGPSNYLQSAYQMMPVGITVEGANILTRSLITFAQGALRSHPYLYKEIQACQDADEERGLAAFDTAFCDHVAFSLSNVFGAFFHNVTFGAVRPRARQGLRHGANGTASCGAPRATSRSSPT